MRLLIAAAVAAAGARRLTPDHGTLPAEHLPGTTRALSTTPRSAPRVRYLVRTDPWTDGWSAKDWTRLARLMLTTPRWRASTARPRS